MATNAANQQEAQTWLQVSIQELNRMKRGYRSDQEMDAMVKDGGKKVLTICYQHRHWNRFLFENIEDEKTYLSRLNKIKKSVKFNVVFAKECYYNEGKIKQLMDGLFQLRSDNWDQARRMILQQDINQKEKDLAACAFAWASVFSELPVKFPVVEAVDDSENALVKVHKGFDYSEGLEWFAHLMQFNVAGILSIMKKESGSSAPAGADPWEKSAYAVFRNTVARRWGYYHVPDDSELPEWATYRIAFKSGLLTEKRRNQLSWYLSAMDTPHVMFMTNKVKQILACDRQCFEQKNMIIHIPNMGYKIQEIRLRTSTNSHEFLLGNISKDDLRWQLPNSREYRSRYDKVQTYKER